MRRKWPKSFKIVSLLRDLLQFPHYFWVYNFLSNFCWKNKRIKKNRRIEIQSLLKEKKKSETTIEFLSSRNLSESRPRHQHCCWISRIHRSMNCPPDDESIPAIQTCPKSAEIQCSLKAYLTADWTKEKLVYKNPIAFKI